MLVAQTNRGGITGTIFDKSGAVVTGATVTVTNKGTNQQFKVKTSPAGAYSLPSLDPVMYSVSVEAEGFKKSVVDNVKVDTAVIGTVDVTLEPGAVSTAITVQAEATTVNTESGTTGSTVTEREIRDVPVGQPQRARSRHDASQRHWRPGQRESGDRDSDPLPRLQHQREWRPAARYINAGRRDQQYRRQPGPHHGEFLARNGAGIYGAHVCLLGRIQHYGRRRDQRDHQVGHQRSQGDGAVVQPQPRVRGGALHAGQRESPGADAQVQPVSLVAGGPVWIPKIYNGKNKTFWFAGFEPNYRRDKLDQYGLLPTDAMRTGDFSGLVNTPSGWLPQSVVDQFRSIAPNAVTATDSVIYNQFNVTNGNRFTVQPLTAGTTLPAVRGQHHSEKPAG
jgi:hypothetical protein